LVAMLKMARELPDDLDRAFTTSVALITTRSSKGDNVMAAEWTYHVSYEPFLVAVMVNPRNATHAAIAESKAFGVNLAAEEQYALSSFTGGFSQREAEKVTSDELKTTQGEALNLPMIEGSLAQLECELVATHAIGDHTQFVGKVVAGRWDSAKAPLLLHQGYHRFGEKIPRGKRLFVTISPEAGARVRVDGFYYADHREGTRVSLEASGPDGALLEKGEAVTDRGGFFEWRPSSDRVARVVGHAEGVTSSATAVPPRAEGPL